MTPRPRQEVVVTVGGATGEADRGAPSINLIPKSGGNSFSGTVFASTAGEWSQGSHENVSFPTLYKQWEVSLAMGGPIIRDSLWFFGTLKSRGQHTAVPNVRANANMNSDAWEYVPNERRSPRHQLQEDRPGPVDEPGDASAQVQLLHRLAGRLRGQQPDVGRWLSRPG